MAIKFSAHDKTGQKIQNLLEVTMELIEIIFDVHFWHPRHDIAHRFLHEITEFEPTDKGNEE